MKLVLVKGLLKLFYFSYDIVVFKVMVVACMHMLEHNYVLCLLESTCE